MRRQWGVPVGAWPLRVRPSFWDVLAIVLVGGLIMLLAWGSRQMAVPYHLGEHLGLSLDPLNLPAYAARTVLRMAIALVLSVLFSLVYATVAAKSPRAERLLIPLLDILQSVPILGYLSVTVVGFMALFPHSLFGVECAAIFAIFTSQAWNITFSLYQSFRTVPLDLQEAAVSYRLSAWQRFLRLELPYALPGLIWNMMMSVSGGWFFVVAAEAITVADHTIRLPGIGSYIALAIADRNLLAVGYAILAMLVVIICYDQLLFRPMLAWAEKFNLDAGPDEERREAWVLTMLRRARLMQSAALLVATNLTRANAALSTRLPQRRARHAAPDRSERRPRAGRRLPFWDAALLLATLTFLFGLWRFIATEVGWHEIGWVFLLGLFTGLRVIVLIALAAAVWVPIGVWIGLRPRLAQRAQPIVQFLAAFPANLLFPAAVVVIVHFHLDPDIWLSPLMVMGTQWYILFNVIAGASALPRELRFAATNFGVSGWLWWRRIMLPAILPAFITGAVTAAGGSWNASIVAEVVQWGPTTLTAHGVGAYIVQATDHGDYPRLALGIGVLACYVVVLNRLLWRRLYDYAAKRTRLE